MPLEGCPPTNFISFRRDWTAKNEHSGCGPHLSVAVAVARALRMAWRKATMIRTWKSGLIEKAVNRAAASSEKLLQSWKEIADYLERAERTARRWEKVAGLPVHRHGERGKGSSVYAYTSELDSWRTRREAKAAKARPQA